MRVNFRNSKFVTEEFTMDKMLKNSSERRPSLATTKSLIVKEVLDKNEAALMRKQTNKRVMEKLNSEIQERRRLTLTVEPIGRDTVPDMLNRGNIYNVIDEGFDEDASLSDGSFLHHMKRIMGHVSSDEDSDSKSVTTDPEFLDDMERSIRSIKADRNDLEH